MYCDYIASLRNEVYPASDLAARPTSRAPMSDLLVDFQCTLGLLSHRKGDRLYKLAKYGFGGDY